VVQNSNRSPKHPFRHHDVEKSLSKVKSLTSVKKMIPNIKSKDIEVRLLSELSPQLPAVKEPDNRRCVYKQIQAEFRHEGLY
jgi:hypothetical protein